MQLDPSTGAVIEVVPARVSLPSPNLKALMIWPSRALSAGHYQALVHTPLPAGFIDMTGQTTALGTIAQRTPGRPVTYGTSEAFLVQFGLESVGHLPGLDELKAAGFLEAMPPSGFDVPNPSDALAPDEDPYTGEEPQDLLTGSAHLDEA